MAVTAQSFLPTSHGDFEVLTFGSDHEHYPHVVLRSKIVNDIPVIRIHSECMTGDVFGSLRCDCGEQLHASMEYIQKNGGAIVYLRQEGRGIGLTEKIKAYALQEKGMNTIQANLELGHSADARDYSVAVEILKSLGWNQIHLMTNNPEKLDQLRAGGIEVIDRIPVVIKANSHNADYLHTKSSEMGHWLNPKD
jgi:3,4-dihydroxy 2-butanone 4-phosphate synthase / GTP cyclohydrolase II